MMQVLSSPSGAGKTTLSRQLLERDPGITAVDFGRPHGRDAPGEIEGRDYYFIDQQKFDGDERSGELLEWAHVFGNYYGTPRKPVARRSRRAATCCSTSTGRERSNCARRAGSDLVSVFILPPSAGELERRLDTRGQDKKNVIAAENAESGRRDEPLARNTITSRQPRLKKASARVCARSSSPNVSSATKRRPLEYFVRKLQAQLTTLSEWRHLRSAKNVRQRNEAFDRDFLGACGRGDAGGFQQRQRDRAQAS